MRYLLALFAFPLMAATSVTSVQVTSTQAILRVATDQSGACSFKVSEVNDFGGSYAPVHDVNTSLFSGSDQCSREGNIESTGYKVLVIGKRTAEVASARRYSRALAANTRHFYQLVVGSDTVTGQFVTGNITLGNTRNDPRFDRSRPGEYAFPSIDWADESKVYIDPLTGLKSKRVSGPGRILPSVVTGRALDMINGTGWSGGSYSGTSRGYLYLRAATPSPAFTSPFTLSSVSLDAVRLVGTFSGTTAIEVCLTTNGVTCAGGVATVGISPTPLLQTIGTSTPILDYWRNGPVPPLRLTDVTPAEGTLTKSGATITYATGRMFPPHLVAGSLVTIGSTDCAIAAVGTEKVLTLANSSCVADGTHNFAVRTFGFLIRAASSTNSTITVTSPTWTSHASGSTNVSGSSGHFRTCSPVRTQGPGGVWGSVCSSTTTTGSTGEGNIIYWFGEDGSVSQVGLAKAPIGSSTLNSADCGMAEGVIWDRTVPGKMYCLGWAQGGTRWSIYSITYTGDYSDRVANAGDILPNSVATLESAPINDAVAAFTASSGRVKFADLPCAEGTWRMFHRQADDLMLLCFTGRPGASQEDPSWVAVFNTTSKSIIAATATWGGNTGSPLRWGGLHSVNVANDWRWVSMTFNWFHWFGAYLARTSQITSGTLTSTFSTCPANIIAPSLQGQPQCSTVTLDSLVPTNSLYGPVASESFILGDAAEVFSGGNPDREVVRILTISGTTVTVQRDFRPYYQQGGPRTLNHSGALSLAVFPGAYKEVWWNYVADPRGEDTTGTHVLEDPLSANCHQLNEGSFFIMACSKFEYIPGAVFRNGLPPASFFSTDVFPVNWDAGFAGSDYIVNILENESHPSAGQYRASDYEKLRWFDARPYSGENRVTAGGSVSNVAGFVWKVAASATTANNMQYRQLGMVGMSGSTQLVDVSPALITNTQGDHYKFCYVVKAGDCYAGSIVGEIYFNVPMLSVVGSVSGRFSLFPDNSQRDITFSHLTHTAGSLLQASSHRKDVYGQTVRRLTSAFAILKEQNTFWNFRPLPDGSRIFYTVQQVENVRNQMFVADLPPYPAEDSVNRGHYVPITLKLHGAPGDEVRVRFGYSENGPATSFFCHERQVACATNAAAPLTPLWTDETQSWQECDSGCTVNVPAIGGRVLYYVIDRRNGGNTTSSAIEAVAVP